MAARRPVPYAALLPAINVGGTRKIMMPALRRCFEAAGCTDVATYIQSGNVVFRSAQARKALVAGLEDAIAEGTGHEVPVVLRTGPELRAVVEANPYPGLDGTQLHVYFVDGPASSVVRELDPTAFAPEAFTVVGSEIYLALPNGMGRATLPSKLLRPKPPRPVTARNWNTVRTLDEMVAALGT